MAHHAKGGPKALYVLGIVHEDQNHHPLDQVLDRGLVTAETSLEHTVQQSGDELLHTRNQQKHTCRSKTHTQSRDIDAL